MQTDQMGIDPQEKAPERNSRIVSTAELSAQMPGIHEPGAWGKLRIISHQAQALLRQATDEEQETANERLIACIRIRKDLLRDIIRECRDRLEMIMDWNQEKVQEIESYIIDTPFIYFTDLAELRARQSIFRSIATSIQKELNL